MNEKDGLQSIKKQWTRSVEVDEKDLYPDFMDRNKAKTNFLVYLRIQLNTFSLDRAASLWGEK